MYYASLKMACRSAYGGSIQISATARTFTDSNLSFIVAIVPCPLAGLLRHRDALSLKRDHDVKHQTGIEEGAAECLWYPLLLSAHRKARTRRTLPETVAARRMSSGVGG